MPSTLACAVTGFLALTQSAAAFYLPGVAPKSYAEGEKVPVFVNTIKPTLNSLDYRLHSVISYDYYNPVFGFCTPEGGPESISESLGSVLFGDRIMTSPYDLHMRKNESCKPLCTTTYDKPRQAFLKRRIEQGYDVNWLVDSLPAAQEMEDITSGEIFYNPGFDLGVLDQDGNTYLNNHYDILIEYHDVLGNGEQLRIVGVIVYPSSKQYSSESQDCMLDLPPLLLDGKQDQLDVPYTYSVYWRPSTTVWATRWDKYLHVFDPEIHWFWLVVSASVVVLLVTSVMSILASMLKKDIARYNRLDDIALETLGDDVLEDGGVQEDSGWKLVHGDVFRTPAYPMLLSVLVGSGSQLFFMVGATMVFALLGFLSPANRGSLGTVIILMYTIWGFVSGYVSARIYKAMQGERFKVNMILTPLLVPGVVFASFFLINLFLWAKQSSSAVPFSTMLVLLAIWFVISIPLSLAGSFVGFRAPAIEAPVHTNQIPRQIPPSTFYLKPIPSMLFVGLLPFLAIFVELYFIMNSIWFSRIYYMFGFLFLCYVLMVITCAAVSILLIYSLLCAENYHWQWRAFMAGGTTGFYTFVNSVLYLVTRVHLSSVAGAVLYIGYSALLSLLVSILTGSIAYFASWWFVRRIYASIKVD